MKRFVSFLLSAGLILSGLPLPVAAEETSGTSESTNLLTNGGFEDDIWGDDAVWSNEVSDWTGLQFSNKSDQVKEGSSSLHYWSETQAGSFSLYQTVSLEAGDYCLSGYASGDSKTSLTFYAGATKADSITLTAWGTWD